MTLGNKKTIFRRFIVYPVLVLVFLFSVLFFDSNQAYAQPVDPNAAPAAGQSTPPEDTETTCAVEKVGWIVCPVIEASATIGDKLFSFLANNFLQTEPELVSSNEGNGTITAWGIARNLANVMFIIAFLVIIYSQVTGAGISNYGLKRMLPRLIVAAIAVNISYYICQGMVDLSNILGFEIKKALVDIANEVSSQHVLASSNGASNTQTSDGGLGTLAKAILVVGGLVWIAIAMLGPTLGLVVITCIVIIIILLLRKAFIVLLVVASPIAFVAYLLPNTEKYFSKWLNMFWQLLMVFPIVALLFGGGQLASSIILAAGMQNTDMYKIEGEGCVNLQQVSNNANANSQSSASTTTPAGPDADCGTTNGPGWMLAMVAAGIAVAPLLAVWAVLKGALAAAGAIGGKIAGAVQKGTAAGVGKLGTPLGAGKKAAQRRMGENMQGAWQRAQARGLSGEGGIGSNLAGRHARRQARRSERLGLSKSGLERSQRETMDRELTTGDPNGIMRGLSQTGQQRAQRGAQASIDKLQAEELQAASLTSRSQSDAELRTVIDGADAARDVNDPRVAAAIQELAQRQDFDGLERAINKFGGAGVGLTTRTLGSSISQNNPGFFTAGDLGQLSRGAGVPGGNYRQMVGNNIANGVFSAEKMAETGPSALREASFVAGQVGGGAHTRLNDAANELLSDARLVGKLSRNRDLVGDMSLGTIVRNNR